MTVEVVDEFDSEHVSELVQLYDQYHWWDDRTSDTIRRMIEHTDVLVGLRDTRSKELVAAGRVLTDFVYYAKIYDVIVTETHRGDGLGRKLVTAIVGHPVLDSVSALTLDCRSGLIPFYEKCGFTQHEQRVNLEERTEEIVPIVYRTE